MKDTSKLRLACLKRADGYCECGCGRWLGDAAELDHQQGRARAPQKLSNCWMLHRDCHAAKTESKPDAETWLERFIRHCKRYGYETERKRAESRLVFVQVRKSMWGAA